MQNRRHSSFLMGIIIFLVVGSLEANVVDHFKGTGKTLDSFILRLGDSERARQGAIAAIEGLDVPDDRIVLAWANLTRLLSRGGILDYPDNLRRWEQATDAVFGLIERDKALAGLQHSSKSGNRDESILARFAIKYITDRLKNSTLEPPPGTVPHFEGTGETLDSFILRLGDSERARQGAIAAIEGLDVPDDRIVLAWANLTRLLSRGGILDYPDNLRRWEQATDAVFGLIERDKALAGLLDSLKGGNRDESILARYAITEIIDRLRESTLEPPPGTVPLLIEALQDEAARIREIASQLLGDIPSHAKDAVPTLINVLTDENEDVRSAAVSTLGRIAVAVPTVQPEITEKLMDLTDESQAVRSAIVDALGYIAVKTPGAQLEITEKLIEVLNAPNVVIYWPHRNINFHVQVARELASIGPAAVPSLLKALNAADAGVRHHAAMALGRIHSQTDETIPLLIQALASPHPYTRRTVVDALVKMAKRPMFVNQILQALVQVLNGTEDTVENRVVRPEAAHTLGQIARAIPAVQPEIIEKLISALHTPNFVSGHFGDDRSHLSNFHVAVADELASIRSAAVPSLLEALNAADASVRHHAAIALAQIDSQPDEAAIRIIPILTEALASPYLHTRAEAVWALERLGKRPTLAGQIAPIFVKVLQTTRNTEPIHYDLTFHDFVASALASIDLSETIKVLRSDNAYVQRFVVAAIAPMNDPAVDEAVPILIELLCSDDRHVRQAAMETLTQLRQFSTDDLIAALTDENRCIRTRSAIVLVEMGPKAMAVLAETLSSQSPETNRQIIEVLETIATPAVRKAISSYQRSGQ